MDGLDHHSYWKDGRKSTSRLSLFPMGVFDSQSNATIIRNMDMTKDETLSGSVVDRADVEELLKTLIWALMTRSA